MKNICIIGAGQIGSRHLQALKSVKVPLNIRVIDLYSSSLDTARERYDSLKIKNPHIITYSQKIDIDKPLDIAIIATSSNVRRKVIEELFSKTKVKYMILEKILFNNLDDYESVSDLLKKSKCKCFVDMSMRTMPFYNSLKKEFDKKSIIFSVSGSAYGLVTNAIHYIDYIANLSDCYDYEHNAPG